jgi:peptide/nickel transport system permease protein
VAGKNASGFAVYAARRFVQFVLVAFTGVTLAFLIVHLSPVNPVDQTVSLMTSFGATDPAGVAMLRSAISELYGVNGSLLHQYLAFWGRVLSGDFGPSLSAFPTPVMTVILRAVPWTAGLLTLSTLLAWALGNILGALAGYYRSSVMLKLAGIVVTAVQPMPAYICGLTLIMLFGYAWPILPISGGAQMNLPAGLNGAFLGSVVTHGMLPAATLMLVSLGAWFNSMRSLVSNIVTEDHVVYAELAGVPRRTVFSAYVARNAMLPQITGLALSLGHVFGGAVIVEFLFAYPGMGQLLIAGINAGDYSLVLGVTTISILSVGFATFVIDIAYPLIDPRVKLG